MDATTLRVNRAITRVGREELARRLGVDQSTVWHWEVGRRPVPERRVPEILATLYGTGDVPRKKTAT